MTSTRGGANSKPQTCCTQVEPEGEVCQAVKSEAPTNCPRASVASAFLRASFVGGSVPRVEPPLPVIRLRVGRLLRQVLCRVEGEVRLLDDAHLARALPSAAEALREATAARAQRVAPHAARAVALLDLRVAPAEEDEAHRGDGDVGDGVEGEGRVEGGGEADDTGEYGAGGQLREERAEVTDADEVGDAERPRCEELARLGVGEGRLLLDEAALGEKRLGGQLCRRPPAQRAAHVASLGDAALPCEIAQLVALGF